MPNRIFSFAIGVIFLGLGICGFMPYFRHLPPARLEYQAPTVSANFGYVFDDISMNVISELMFVGVGIVGIVAAATLFTSRLFAQVLFFGAFMLLCCGLLPLGMNDLLGLMPIYEWCIPMALITTVVSFYFAFIEGPAGEFWRQPILPQ